MLCSIVAARPRASAAASPVASASVSRACCRARAPAAKVLPASPSPLRASRASSSACAAISACATRASAAAHCASRGPWRWSSSRFSAGAKGCTACGTRTPGQPRVCTGACSAASTSASAGARVIEKPCMSIEVISAAGTGISATRSTPMRCNASRVSTPSSCVEQPPRSLSISTSGASAPRRASACASSGSRTSANASSTVPGCTGRAPGSLWMPRPSSGARRPICWPGTLQLDKAMPSDSRRSAKAWPRCASSASGTPSRARWPTYLCTSTVPAMPRGCAASGRAMSSATSTLATAMPSARARSAARPKLSRSPV